MWYLKRSFSIAMTFMILIIMVFFYFIIEGFREMSIISLITGSAVFLILIFTIIDYFRNQKSDIISGPDVRPSIISIIFYIFCVAISVFYLITEGIESLDVPQLIVIAIIILTLSSIIIRYFYGFFNRGS